MVPVLEAVPNFSEGRDLRVVEELVGVIASCDVDVLDWSADPDHHRSVVTYVGPPDAVVDASLAAARFALEHIDLRVHEGVHPRIGALDVLPFVPLHGLEMAAAVSAARRAGAGLAEMGIPVYFYGEASDPPGRRLPELRRGGIERLWTGYPEGGRPDLPAEGPARERPHPRAGITCVGARKLLLAWNVYVRDVDIAALEALAGELRESGGGFPGVRALALRLPRAGRSQISMNVEDLDRTSPFDVFRAIEEGVAARGGAIEETEVIGMIPDALVLPAAADRLKLLGTSPQRLLSTRIVDHLARRGSRETEA